ncbi:hypothetical protein [Pantoea sp. FN0302]|uniref:hypothetical protein n=1 Tax=Pantoea sp. FN0302 TaxID=3418558 RepID=UPI003CFA93AF
MPPEQASLMSDPRIIGAVIAAILAFLAPTIRDFLITKRTKKNLIKILIVDVSARVQKVDNFLIPFQLAINKAKSENEYMPWVSYNEGLEDHIDWKDEKWLMPKDLVAEIVGFYSNTKSLIKFIESINSDRYKEISRERQIAMLEGLLEDLKQSYQEGFKLLKLLQSKQGVS